MTEKLYDTDPYIKEFTATVISCTPCDNGYAVILDKTAFFPEEGGQKCDTGTLGASRVLAVTIDGETITHYTDAPVTGTVSCVLDFDARLDKMRQHTGEHILSGTIHRLFGYDNVGFHLGDDDVTCDFDGPLDAEKLRLAETEANLAVLKNRKVFGYYPDKETLTTLDFRSKSGIDGAVRIVEIEGIDLCACCAPHVAYTGEVGLIKITDASSYKGGMRLHIACGERALADYQKKSDNLSVIAKTLSSSQNNAARYFCRYVDETNALKQALSASKRELIALKAKLVDNSARHVIIEDGLDMNTLRQYVNALSGKYTDICAVLSPCESGFAFTAASDKTNMRDVAKTLTERFGARCGGSDKMIQGTVNTDSDTVKRFFEGIII